MCINPVSPICPSIWISFGQLRQLSSWFSVQQAEREMSVNVWCSHMHLELWTILVKHNWTKGESCTFGGYWHTSNVMIPEKRIGRKAEKRQRMDRNKVIFCFSAVDWWFSTITYVDTEHTFIIYYLSKKELDKLSNF